MKLLALQDQIKRIVSKYADEHDLNPNADWAFIKFQEEFGELAEAYLAHTKRNRIKDSNPTKTCLEDEWSDAFCFLLYFASQNNLDIQEAIKRKWLKWMPDVEAWEQKK